MEKLFDSHAHLDSKKYDNQAEIINNLGDMLIMNVSADKESMLTSLKLAKENTNIYTSVGIHPHDAKTFDDETLKLMEELLKEEKVKAIGEIGLDYYYDLSKREVQKEVFKIQLELAIKKDMPVILHIRKAHDDALRILKSCGVQYSGVVHCFSGGVELMKEYLKLGFYVGITGVVTFKNANKIAKVAKEMPLDKLLIETDCPYMAPVPYRGKTNIPNYVYYVAETIAKLRGDTTENIIEQTSINAQKLYRIEL